MRLGHNPDPVSEYKQESTLEQRCLLCTLLPFVSHDELEHFCHIKQFLQFDAMFSLDFANDAHKVQDGVFL